jgi:hypothetical protein
MQTNKNSNLAFVPLPKTVINPHSVLLLINNKGKIVTQTPANSRANTAEKATKNGQSVQAYQRENATPNQHRK